MKYQDIVSGNCSANTDRQINSSVDSIIYTDCRQTSLQYSGVAAPWNQSFMQGHLFAENVN